MFFIFSFFTSSEEFTGIFKKHFNENIIVIDASGSSYQDINGSKQRTKPEYAIEPFDKMYDWCSNCGLTYDFHPWITFSLQNKKMRINKYFLRFGCCYEGCCCAEYGYCVDCCMYSWSLQISDDNKTWKEIHRVEKDYDTRNCNEKTYKLDDEYTGKYLRIIQNEPCPGSPPCIAINKIDFFGDVLNENDMIENDFVSFHDDDDDVSIIGHISKNGNVRLE